MKDLSKKVEGIPIRKGLGGDSTPRPKEKGIEEIEELKKSDSYVRADPKQRLEMILNLFSKE